MDILADAFPELRGRLPQGEALKPGEYPPEGAVGFNNWRSREVLGLTYRPLRESVVDTAKSLLDLMKR